jgi:hypothetical protein
MTDLYQSDVRTLSDDELEVLSKELEEEYRHSGYEEDYWTDDAAETRYWQLHAEARRRWEIAHPEWKPPKPSEVTLLCLKAMAESLHLAAAVSRQYDAEFERKAGDHITIRLPYRFQE